ncbi:MAG: ATP-dependent 6-phosphofructokinase [bacterium]
MTDFCDINLEIQRLGECTYDSPIELSHVLGDYVSNFVLDTERILYHNRFSRLQECLDRLTTIPSFEAAGPRDKIFFDPQHTKAAIVTCGGLCPGLNDVIRGLVLCLTLGYGVRDILGIRYGFAGLNEDENLHPIHLTPSVVEDIHTRGGTFLGSSRGPQPIEKMVDFMEKRGINILFTIGGDGTQRGALALTEEIKKRGLMISIVGIPKTIDNDIFHVDRSFGFETAYSIAANVLISAHAEAVGAFNGIAVVKIMGRHSGFLAAHAAIASGEVNFLLVPEIPFDIDPPNGLLAALEKRILQRHHALIAVAEGAGQGFLQKEGVEYDASGNVKLADIGVYLKERITDYFRERRIPASIKYIDPSYYVRSTEATPTDRLFCLRLAHNAAHAAMTGRTGMVVGFWNNAFTHVPIPAAVERRKVIDPEDDLWLTVLDTTGQPNLMLNN